VRRAERSLPLGRKQSSTGGEPNELPRWPAGTDASPTFSHRTSGNTVLVGFVLGEGLP
jgi:hypothetical protein